MEIVQVEYDVEKMSLVFHIIAFGLVPASSHYYEENTCRQQSRFQQRVLKVKTSLIEIFFKVYLAKSEQKVY